jgi:predicted transcriptional regulator YheO
MEEKLDSIIAKLDQIIKEQGDQSIILHNSSKKQQAFNLFDGTVKDQYSLNKNKAADLLGISRRSLYNYLAEWRELRKDEHENGLLKPKF